MKLISKHMVIVMIMITVTFMMKVVIIKQNLKNE